jgi:DNA-binding SARP family transcriptional activator/tetratricopeptide (TPR) repeat protein
VRVAIALMGGFAVSIDGVVVSAEQWRRRRAAALVKLLALAPRAQLHRDRVIDALWPDVGLEVALPRLHKAAHFARHALRVRDAVLIKAETVSLFPGVALDVDVAAFDAAADAALHRDVHSVDACMAALALHRGELLPDDLHEPWSEQARLRLASRYEQLLRGARHWQDLLRLDPADEESHVELLREAVARGDRTLALRRYAEMERILTAELGIGPSVEATALLDRALTVPAPTPPTVPVRRHRSQVVETLVERDRERSALRRIMGTVVHAGRGSVVTVTGEAGSGKSALVRAFVDDLGDGPVVAMGSCDDLLAPRGLGPFRDMVDALPDLAAVLSGPGQPDDVFAALLRSLAVRPTALVIEDLHWADDATLDAVRYLSRRISAVPAVLLLTFREEDIDATHPLHRILGSLSRPLLQRIELAPLSVDAIRRLGGVDEEQAAEIHRITKGNPFFVTEVLDADGDGVPASVRDAVLARVGRLPRAVRSLAERLAVVPSRAERRLAEALAGIEPAALGHLERCGVITGGAEHVAFRHELARRAIKNSLTVSELIQANREVLDVLLRQSPIEPSRIVHHAAAAVRTDLLMEYGPVAATHAREAGAHRQAAETLRVVLEHADRLDPAARAELLTRRAYSLYVVNDYETALRCADSAVAAAEDSADPGILAEALMTLSRITLFARGPANARRAAERAVRILGEVGDDTRLATGLIELARTYSNLPTLGILAQPSTAGVRHAEHAVMVCERLGRDDLRAQALCYLGSGKLAQGDPQGMDDLERALRATTTEPRVETRVRIYVNAAGSAFRAGRRRDAERYVTAGLREAADGEFAAGRYRLHLTSAALVTSTGPWDRAVAELRRLVTSPERPGLMALLARALLARLLARRGDPDAGGVLDEALADPTAAADSYVAGPLAVAKVELGWLAGAVDPVTPAVRAAWEMATQSGHTAMVGELAGYLRRAGCDAPLPTTDTPGPWAFALAGRWQEAAAAWRELGERYEEAVELAWCGDNDDARAAGLAILEDLGASATVARVCVSHTDGTPPNASDRPHIPIPPGRQGGRAGGWG